MRIAPPAVNHHSVAASLLYNTFAALLLSVIADLVCLDHVNLFRHRFGGCNVLPLLHFA